MELIKHTTIRQSTGRYLGFILGICWILLGCTQDLEENLPTAQSVFLSIQLPEPMAQNIKTRAGATDYNLIKDINVIIANQDQIIAHGYYYFQEGVTYVNPEVSWKAENKLITIHFNKDLTQRDNLTQKQFYIVANYGKINQTEVRTITQLRALTQKSSTTAGVPNGCVMFAQATHTGQMHQHTDGTSGMSLKAPLKRTVAMVTVAVDGSGLNKNICLNNFSISLHNVPTECTIGKDNMPNKQHFAANGEYKEYQQLAWNPIVGTASKTNCSRQTWRNYAQVAGGHYQNPDVNPSDRSIDPLFQFENIHGKGFGASDVTITNQGHKRPASVTSTDKNAIEAGSTDCSYIKVKAHYEKIDDKGNSLISGWVSFKLFLGENVTDNFDVRGNHYYKVTLSLKGNAVTEGGQINANGELQANPDAVTWRVDSNLGKASFTTDDLNFNAGGEFFYIDVTGTGPCWVKGKDDYFVWIYGSQNKDGSGSQWQSAANGTWVHPTKDQKGHILAYVQPCYADFTGTETIKRSMVLELYDKTDPNPYGDDGKLINSMKITQWKWIELTVTSAEYPYIKEQYGKDEITMKLDRVDREARPWGFDGEELHMNSNNGFENTFYLFEENSTEHNGHNHREFAKRYLPFGTETRINGQIIDDGGSAMIYAAMLYENQDMQQPNVDPNQLENRTFPIISKEDGWGNRWYWAIPSLEAWQLIEKEAKKGHLDPNFPIKDWFQYWSSDAVTIHSPDGPGSEINDPQKGCTHSYAYQFGRGLDSMKEGDLYPAEMRFVRTDALRFRLVSMQPSNIIIQ